MPNTAVLAMMFPPLGCKTKCGREFGSLGGLLHVRRIRITSPLTQTLIIGPFRLDRLSVLNLENRAQPQPCENSSARPPTLKPQSVGPIAVSGATLDARRAGRYPGEELRSCRVRRPRTVSTAGRPGRSPKSWVLRRRPASKANGSPIATPPANRINASRSTMVSRPARSGTQRHSESKLAGPADRRVGHHAIEAQGGEHQGELPNRVTTFATIRVGPIEAPIRRRQRVDTFFGSPATDRPRGRRGGPGPPAARDRRFAGSPDVRARRLAHLRRRQIQPSFREAPEILPLHVGDHTDDGPRRAVTRHVAPEW